jgi:DNA mismatch repair protein MutH
MVNASKVKGTTWESAVRDYLQRSGWPTVERLPLNGNRDRGDLAGIPDVTIEAKAGRGWDHLGQWISQAEVERHNAGSTFGVVWAKRIGSTSAASGYVIMTGSTFVDLLRRAGL